VEGLVISLSTEQKNRAQQVSSLFSNAYSGKTVFITGHTGFKGSWLCEWLLLLGARVVGYSLPAPTQPALFDLLGLRTRIRHIDGDIRELNALTEALVDANPDFVFHLAAQTIVRDSYQRPIETFSTNALGTAHVLEAARSLTKNCGVICVTTDKCYENHEWHYGYREVDPLGGHDPYSSSKAAAEIVIASWRRSFFRSHPVKIASVRAGNVIGGGDWAQDRIVPDCIRALQCGNPIPVRNPKATRPWQHVLEPLSGYLLLAARIYGASLDDLCSAFNFGPRHESNRSVAEMVQEILTHWPGTWEDKSELGAPHEAGRLNLAIDKAFHLLAWQPVWSFGQAVAKTVEWYRYCGIEVKEKEAIAFTRQQITEYETAAREKGLSWAS